MVPFSKSAVCVCHSTASFMVHSLSFLSLSLLQFVFDRTFFSSQYVPYVSVFVLCASCCVMLKRGCWGFPYLFLVFLHSSNLWFYSHLIKAAPRLRIDGLTFALLPPKAICSLQLALVILILWKTGMNEVYSVFVFFFHLNYVDPLFF